MKATYPFVFFISIAFTFYYSNSFSIRVKDNISGTQACIQPDFVTLNTPNTKNYPIDATELKIAAYNEVVKRMKLSRIKYIERKICVLNQLSLEIYIDGGIDRPYLYHIELLVNDYQSERPKYVVKWSHAEWGYLGMNQDIRSQLLNNIKDVTENYALDWIEANPNK